MPKKTDIEIRSETGLPAEPRVGFDDSIIPIAELVPGQIVVFGLPIIAVRRDVDSFTLTFPNGDGGTVDRRFALDDALTALPLSAPPK